MNLPLSIFTRPRKRPVTTIVVHATAGGSAESSIRWLQKIGLSYHYIIERDGRLIKCAPVSRVAFHCGKSLGPQGPNVNEYSIGIAFANRNDGEPITDAQRAALKKLVGEIAAVTRSIQWITTHRDISPGRKTDPVGFRVFAIVDTNSYGLILPWRIEENP